MNTRDRREIRRWVCLWMMLLGPDEGNVGFSRKLTTNSVECEAFSLVFYVAGTTLVLSVTTFRLHAKLVCGAF